MSEQPHTDNTPHPATAGDVQSGSNVQETQFDLSKLAEAPAAEYSQPPPVSASVQQTPAVSEHQSAAHDLSALASAPQPHINNAFAGQDSDLSQLLPVLQDHSTSSSIPSQSHLSFTSHPGIVYLTP